MQKVRSLARPSHVEGISGAEDSRQESPSKQVRHEVVDAKYLSRKNNQEEANLSPRDRRRSHNQRMFTQNYLHTFSSSKTTFLREKVDHS